MRALTYRGILYAGLMLTSEGPKLIEYNVRFGDPECQVLLPRLMTDLCQLFLGGTEGQLSRMDLRWRPVHMMTVVMAAKGYPGAYGKGSEIRGLDAAEADRRGQDFSCRDGYQGWAGARQGRTSP